MPRVKRIDDIDDPHQKVWDIKDINISLGSNCDKNGFLKLEIFNDQSFGIYFNQDHTGECEFFLESMHLNVAKKIRDFLNYAIKD